MFCWYTAECIFLVEVNKNVSLTKGKLNGALASNSVILEQEEQATIEKNRELLATTIRRTFNILNPVMKEALLDHMYVL